MSDVETWVVTDGKSGMENQCVGLAEAVGLPFAVKRIDLPAPWRWLSPQIIAAAPERLGARGDRLPPPWPRLLIATGRASVGPAMVIRRRSNGATFAVQIQNPGVAARHFDLIVAPEHDRLTDANVISTVGALHRVTPERLAAEARTFAPALAHLPRPLLAVLVGGNNKSFRFDAAVAARLGEGLASLCERSGAGLAVTVSRRTGVEATAALRDRLRNLPAVLWDGTGANPYFGYLGLADAIVVTCDSVSMTSEAAGTGKPVYVFDLPGRRRKFDAFHASLLRRGITRPFAGALEQWTYQPPRDTERVAAEVRRRLELAPLSRISGSP